MKATYNGWSIEGTPEELGAVISSNVSSNAKKNGASTSPLLCVHKLPVQKKTEIKRRRKHRTNTKSNPQHYRGWTPAKDAEAIKLYLSGRTADQVGKMVGRTGIAIQTRMHELGVMKTKQQKKQTKVNA